MIKLKTLDGNLSWIMWLGPVYPQGPYKGEARESEWKGGVTTKAEVEVMPMWGRGREPKHAGVLWKLETAKEQILP